MASTGIPKVLVVDEQPEIIRVLIESKIARQDCSFLMNFILN
jgi:hypothetical protein